MADETYYSILEIPETATAAEVKGAYRRLIGEVHPDRVANAPVYWQRQAEEKSKEINEAYSMLSNHEKRSLYDAQLAAYRGHRTTTSTSSTSSTSTRQQHYQTPPTSPPSTTSPPSAPASTSHMSGGHRFFFAFIGWIFAFGATTVYWGSSSFTGNDILLFLFATTVWFGVIYLYRRYLSWIFRVLGIKQVRAQLWTMIAIVAFALLAGKIVHMNRDTHFRGENTRPATSSEIAQVKIINGSLSTTPVSGNSNEKYASAYDFTAHIQNNLTVQIYFIKMKIRIFDCLQMGIPTLHTEYKVTYKSGMFDPSPPDTCKKIGEEEEDNFPSADPGESPAFANFYFPERPLGDLRWNYEITQMDVLNVVAPVPASAKPVQPSMR